LPKKEGSERERERGREGGREGGLAYQVFDALRCLQERGTVLLQVVESSGDEG